MTGDVKMLALDPHLAVILHTRTNHFSHPPHPCLGSRSATSLWVYKVMTPDTGAKKKLTKSNVPFNMLGFSRCIWIIPKLHLNFTVTRFLR